MMTMTEQASMKDNKLKKKQDDLNLLTVEEAVAEFVGEIDDLHKVDVNSLFDDNYRVNVWTVTRRLDRFCDTYKISQSYYMKFLDGKLTDLTIAPKEYIGPCSW
jgi:hypothetical protein